MLFDCPFSFLLTFIVMGFLGGLANVLLWAQDYPDLTKYQAIKRISLGIVVGYLYPILYSEYNFPNHIMTFVCGYCACDFIQGIIERCKRT